MSILWSTTVDGIHYEVRTAGYSIRLYTNGIFHTQYNPNHIFSGAVWDLMSLPFLAMPANKVKRILVLGVGGGAVIHQLYHIKTDIEITAIELNPTHIDIAERFFDLSYPSLNLVHSDALQWVNHYEGPGFDMIIDDVFGEDSHREPFRVFSANQSWCTQLFKLLNVGGMLVMNFADRQSLNDCYFNLKAPFLNTRWMLKTPLYENRIGLFSEAELSPATFRKVLQKHPVTSKKIQNRKIRFTVIPLN